MKTTKTDNYIPVGPIHDATCLSCAHSEFKTICKTCKFRIKSKSTKLTKLIALLNYGFEDDRRNKDVNTLKNCMGVKFKEFEKCLSALVTLGYLEYVGAGKDTVKVMSRIPSINSPADLQLKIELLRRNTV